MMVKQRIQGIAIQILPKTPATRVNCDEPERVISPFNRLRCVVSVLRIVHRTTIRSPTRVGFLGPKLCWI